MKHYCMFVAVSSRRIYTAKFVGTDLVQVVGDFYKWFHDEFVGSKDKPILKIEGKAANMIVTDLENPHRKPFTCKIDEYQDSKLTTYLHEWLYPIAETRYQFHEYEA